jgi:MFS family permease
MTAALLALNRRTFASLKHRNYRLFFTGQAISVIGTWMQRVAQAWVVLELTHSAVAVGILALAQFMPFTVFGLFAGVIVDRRDARKLVIVTQTAQMVLSSVLAGIALSGFIQAWHVYVIAALLGVTQVLDAPGRQALTYAMVGPAELPNAIGLNSSLFNGARIFGPALGGLAIAAVGASAAFAANAASYLAVLASLLAMRRSELHAVERGERATMLRGIREGFAYVRHSRRAAVVLVLVGLVSLFSVNFNVLLPVLAKRTLESGAETYGLLASVFGAGALIGALTTAALGRASLKLLLLGTAGYGAVQLVLAPQRSLGTVLVLLFLAGVCFTTWSSNANTLLQLEAPDHLRGRVIGLFFFGFAGTGSLGGVLAGWLAAAGGTELAFVISGIVPAVLAVAAAAAIRPSFARRILAPFAAETRT